MWCAFQNSDTYPQCCFLELVHGPELLEPVENNIVKWRIRCISILFDPWVIYKLKYKPICCVNVT